MFEVDSEISNVGDFFTDRRMNPVGERVLPKKNNATGTPSISNEQHTPPVFKMTSIVKKP